MVNTAIVTGLPVRKNAETESRFVCDVERPSMEDENRYEVPVRRLPVKHSHGYRHMVSYQGLDQV